MITEALDLFISGLQLDQLRLAEGSPNRGSEEEKNEALFSHERPERPGFLRLIKYCPNVGRARANGWPQVLSRCGR